MTRPASTSTPPAPTHPDVLAGPDVLAPPFGGHNTSGPGAASGLLWRRVARAALSPWCRLTVEGREHVPASGGVLIAANHLSHADSIALGLAVRKRTVSFLGDERLAATPVIGRHLVSLGMVAIQRGEADLDALDHLVDLLGAGHAVVVYPEGSRSRTGEVHRPRSGVARIAAMANVPVVPAGLAGTQRLWPVDGNPNPLGGRVAVRFGPACSPSSNSGRDRRAFNEQLHDELVALSRAPRADHFAPVRGGATEGPEA